MAPKSIRRLTRMRKGFMGSPWVGGDVKRAPCTWRDARWSERRISTMRFAAEAEPARPVVVSPAASQRDQIRMRPGTPSVVPPVESALPGVVAEEPNADRGKRLQNVPFGGRLEVRIRRPTVGV